MKIKESQLRKIISEAIENVLSVNQILLNIKEKAKAVIDYLYNEGVIAYDDEHLQAMAKDMSLIDFKDICKTILWDYNTEISPEERKILEEYLKTGSYPELEDKIANAVTEYAEDALGYSRF